MALSLDGIYVHDLMRRDPLTVGACDQLLDVAKRFQHHGINSAPVIDSSGRCVGIITSTDLVRFEAEREQLEAKFQRGAEFDAARYDNDRSADQLRYDQVGSHMTAQYRSVPAGITVTEAVSIMVREHLHHLLILDGLGRPYGILSGLDVLEYLIGQQRESQ